MEHNKPNRPKQLLKLLPLLVLLGACATGILQEKMLSMPTVEGASYVGEEACADCHEDVTEAFTKNVHGRLADFELSLHRAMSWLAHSGRTFRVERVPLCYMAGFEHCSTETRKIVKAEERLTHFLDRRGAVRQGPEAFFHEHHPACDPCALRGLCAGLYERGHGYDPAELAPQFVKGDVIKARIVRRGVT